jgi:Dolichyl-phosphate-mannose-protein mannosyltransferase
MVQDGQDSRGIAMASSKGENRRFDKSLSSAPRQLEWHVAVGPALLALVLNLCFFSAFQDHLTPDSASYIAAAHSLLLSAAFNNDAGQPETIRTPGYPLFLSPFFAFSFGMGSVAFVQHLLLAVMVGAVAVAGFRVSGNPIAGVGAGMILALDLAGIVTANDILTETLSTAFLLAASWQAYSAVTSDSHKAQWLAGFAGLLAGWAVLIRPVALFYGGPLALFFLIAAKPGLKCRTAVVALVAFSVFPGFWIARNYRISGHATISPISGINMLLYRAAGALAANDPGNYTANFGRRKDELQALACENLERIKGRPCAELSIADRASYYSELGARIMIHTPGGSTKLVLRGLGMVVLGGGAEQIAQITGVADRKAQVICLFYTVPVALLALLGTLYWFRRNRAIFWLLLLTLPYFFIISAGAEGYSRFRVPVMPLYAILAGGGVALLSDKFLTARRRVIGERS